MNKMQKFVIRCYSNMAVSNYKKGLSSKKLMDKRFELMECWVTLNALN